MDELLAEHRAEIDALLTTIAELEAQLNAKDLAINGLKLAINSYDAQLKTAKRDAILEVVEETRYFIGNDCRGEPLHLCRADALISYANTIGEE